MNTLTRTRQDIEEDAKDLYKHFRKSKLQKSRLWKNRDHSFYDKKKNEKPDEKPGEIPKYIPIKKHYSNTEKLLNILPTKRVTELKLVLTLLAILIIIVLGIVFFMFLKAKKII